MFYLISIALVIFTFLFTSAVACIIAIPLFFILKYLNNKYFHLIWLTPKKLKISLICFVIVFALFQTYTAFYPTDSFYKDEFENNTGLKFPKSGDIIAKDASYPDTHGDYSATVLFKVNQEDFDLLLTSIQRNNKFNLDTFPFKIKLPNLDTTVHFNVSYIQIQRKRDLNFIIGFNDKDKLIGIQRDSW
ncbi:MAG: hypothetical protein KF900_14525 [Bacteroidetes bacterium]|nr:hypothetical protein [Bacteroidota bacterium]